MSKSDLPTQKGTELHPTTTRMPAVIRVNNVDPHSEVARSVAQRFAAPINHFHKAQAQNYSLSPIENYRAHTAIPGIKMTYTNLQGSETLDITVSDEILKEESSKNKKVNLPDWCIINLHVDGGAYFPGASQLAITRDAAPKIDVLSGLPFSHVAADGFGYGFDDGSASPLIAYPDPAGQTLVASLADGVVISSLKVDLRGLGEHGSVVYDLWGTMSAGANESRPDGTYSHTPAFPYASRVDPDRVVASVFFTEYVLSPGSVPRTQYVPPEARDWGNNTGVDPYSTHTDYFYSHGLLVEEDGYVAHATILSSEISTGPYPGAGQFNYRLDYIVVKRYYDIVPNLVSAFVYKPVTSFLTFQFYGPGAKFDVVQEGFAPAAYWALRGAPLGTIVGTKFSDNIVSTSATDLTYDLFGRFQQPLIGRVTVDRAGRSVGFKPA